MLINVSVQSTLMTFGQLFLRRVLEKPVVTAMRKGATLQLQTAHGCAHGDNFAEYVDYHAPSATLECQGKQKEIGPGPPQVCELLDNVTAGDQAGSQKLDRKV